MPCYNEADNLPHVIARLQQALEGVPHIEVILVNNGSTDNSSDVLRRELEKPENSFGKLVEVPVNKGYGFGIMEGVRESLGEVIAWTHADLQTDPGDVLQAYDKFKAQADQSRTFLKGRRLGRSLFDTFFTFGMSLICSVLLKQWLFDVNAQPKMFHRSFLNFIDQPPDDFSIDLYVFFMARSHNLSVVEHPVRFHDRRYGEAKGGGSSRGKLRLILRSWSYILRLKRRLDT